MAHAYQKEKKSVEDIAKLFNTTLTTVYRNLKKMNLIKGRINRVNSNDNTCLSEEQKLQIKELLKKGISSRKIAKQLNISPTTIYYYKYDFIKRSIPKYQPEYPIETPIVFGSVDAPNDSNKYPKGSLCNVQGSWYVQVSPNKEIPIWINTQERMLNKLKYEKEKENLRLGLIGRFLRAVGIYN